MDLPGRRRIAADLSALTIDDCVTAVVRQIDSGDAAHEDEMLVLVGHSLAGVVLSGVADRLWRNRAVHVVFVACCVPAPGQSVLDTLPNALRHIVGHLVRRSPVIDRVPPGLLRYAFGNHATTAQRACIVDNIVPESSSLLTEPVRAGFPESVRKSWVLTMRDRALPARKQRAFIRNAGGVDEVAAIDAAHEAMITHPHELAAALLQLCDSDARA